MITRQMAIEFGEARNRTLYHKVGRNADGTAIRCRINGRCQVWKTRPDDFRLPVKYGLKSCFDITPSNADEWLPFDVTELAKEVGMKASTPLWMLQDKLLDNGYTFDNDRQEWVSPAKVAV